MWQPISESHSEMQVSEYPETTHTTQTEDIFIQCITVLLTKCNWHWLWHTYACCVSQGTIKKLLKWDWWFPYHFVPFLSENMCAKKYQNRAWFDNVMTTITWCSFFLLTVYSTLPHKTALEGSGGFQVAYNFLIQISPKGNHLQGSP